MNVHISTSSASQLTRRRKAAMVVQMLISDGGQLALTQLPEALQEVLARELGAIRLVDRETVCAVAEEFVNAADAVGLSASGTHDGAIMAIADHLSPGLADRLHKQTESVRNGDHWPIVAALPSERIVAIMMAESIEVCAVTLSKLSVSKAAEVLNLTSGDRARRISLAMSQTANTLPNAVSAIGTALAEDYGQVPVLAFEKAPVQRLGAILNATQPKMRDDVLEGLGGADPEFASHVRKAIFTFKDIVERIKPLDVPSCIRAVPADVLTTAVASGLAGDDQLKASAEFILANVSQRMATQIREDADERGAVKKSDAETAMAAVTTAIRALVDDGTISLQDLDTEEDEA